MKRDTLLNEYISSVSSRLVCPSKQKKDFLNQLSDAVELYISEKENATKEELEGVFGSPESIASEFISNTDSKELRRKISLKKFVVIAVTLALLIYFAFVVISLIDVHTEAHGYFEEGIVPAVIGLVKGCAV